MNIKISYVIPVFNEKNTIKKAITDVLRLPIKKEIIVIDNNSYDGTKEILINFKKKNKNKNIFVLGILFPWDPEFFITTYFCILFRHEHVLEPWVLERWDIGRTQKTIQTQKTSLLLAQLSGFRS